MFLLQNNNFLASLMVLLGNILAKEKSLCIGNIPSKSLTSPVLKATIACLVLTIRRSILLRLLLSLHRFYFFCYVFIRTFFVITVCIIIFFWMSLGDDVYLMIINAVDVFLFIALVSSSPSKPSFVDVLAKSGCFW